MSSSSSSPSRVAAASTTDNKTLAAQVEGQVHDVLTKYTKMKIRVDEELKRTSANQTELDALRAERDALTAERDALTAERDALTTELDDTKAERDAIKIELDSDTTPRTPHAPATGAQLAIETNMDLPEGTLGDLADPILNVMAQWIQDNRTSAAEEKLCGELYDLSRACAKGRERTEEGCGILHDLSRECDARRTLEWFYQETIHGLDEEVARSKKVNLKKAKETFARVATLKQQLAHANQQLALVTAPAAQVAKAKASAPAAQVAKASAPLKAKAKANASAPLKAKAKAKATATATATASALAAQVASVSADAPGSFFGARHAKQDDSFWGSLDVSSSVDAMPAVVAPNKRKKQPSRKRNTPSKKPKRPTKPSGPKREKAEKDNIGSDSSDPSSPDTEF